jgi:hypothetical protein
MQAKQPTTIKNKNPATINLGKDISNSIPPTTIRIAAKTDARNFKISFTISLSFYY